MARLRINGRDFRRAACAVLLVFQGAAGTGLAVLHASERLSAPAAIEAEHGAACVVMHDPARCPVCHTGIAGSIPEPVRTPLALATRRERRAHSPIASRPVRSLMRAAAPRAPPLLSA